MRHSPWLIEKFFSKRNANYYITMFRLACRITLSQVIQIHCKTTCLDSYSFPIKALKYLFCDEIPIPNFFVILHKT